MWLIDRMDLMASLILRILREYSARSCCGESEGNSYREALLGGKHYFFM